jgi:adenylate kinase family enzyme
MERFPYRRIVVIGPTGAGKSTLAEQLAALFDLDYIELDALNWQPNWQPARPEQLRESVKRALSSDSWVVAGNYSSVRSLIWPRAQAVIWLDYALPLVFCRLLWRTIRRSVLQEELWNGNREKFWWHLKFWSDESLFRWLFKTYWRRKLETPLLLSQPMYAHLKLIHLKSIRQTDAWLRHIEP